MTCTHIKTLYAELSNVCAYVRDVTYTKFCMGNDVCIPPLNSGQSMEASTEASSIGKLRSKMRVNYREANDIRLPRAERARSGLFPVHLDS